MSKVPYTFKLDGDLLLALQKEAADDNRSFNNYVETILKGRRKPAKR